MVKVCGIELQVGEKPPQVYTSHMLGFNDVFLRMMEAFESNPNARVVFTFNGKHEEDLDSLNQKGGPDYYHRFGYLLCSKVWKVLAYNQLVKVTRTKEQYECQYSHTKKKRTLTIVEPTSVGIHAYEHGQILTVEQQHTLKQVEIGVGKPYSTHREEWERLERMAKQGGVAKTRILSWGYEFKTYYEINLLTQPKEVAENMVVKLARQKIANAPTRHGKRNKIRALNSALNGDAKVKQLNHSLGNWMPKK